MGSNDRKSLSKGLAVDTVLVLHERKKELPDYSQQAVGFLECLTVDLAGIDVLNSTQVLVEGCTCLISVSEIQVRRVWRNTQTCGSHNFPICWR